MVVVMTIGEADKFPARWVNWDMEVCLRQIYGGEEVPLVQGGCDGTPCFHLELLVDNEVVEPLQIQDCAHIPILFWY